MCLLVDLNVKRPYRVRSQRKGKHGDFNDSNSGMKLKIICAARVTSSVHVLKSHYRGNLNTKCPARLNI